MAMPFASRQECRRNEVDENIQKIVRKIKEVKNKTVRMLLD